VRKIRQLSESEGRHDDVMSGLRTWNIAGETVLAYVVDDAALAVMFVGITYGVQNWMEIFSMRPLGPLQ
jgi:toxin ParE1/3/4